MKTAVAAAGEGPEKKNFGVPGLKNSKDYKPTYERKENPAKAKKASAGAGSDDGPSNPKKSLNKELGKKAQYKVVPLKVKTKKDLEKHAPANKKGSKK